ncbi:MULTISPECIES: ABC transporter ATP-binding protein [unclassified Oceanispirochaeta]|uniref:ABC transporter ATP-binding protein n=1 Tax=unclassified Oceanispirochaeta TaxID=2635722 RepID=UPI000E0974E4|nr:MULTISPECIES: ABC transporter ATP-binding protein [unclassified Oceanispirochaeta]MBF9014493.1 ABC transporter ATP-binding protein [Oceanispirochaeta sp. M2]NPD70749.1 ABC transporter ATP-binding protein [Oceanispirochaeta sp. M1]RDG34030.1 ABC transporter ATP-binding protein [Oceanispirochaeta sp. M1]
MLKVEHLSKNYGRVKPIRDISFTLQKGEVLGLLGANGTGKSTTLNMLAGYFPPSGGSISLNGFNIQEQPLEYKKNIGYLPEFPPLYPDMTVREQLYMVCSVKGISRKERQREIERVCGLSRIPDVIDRPVKTMSKGYKQRIGLAQALIGNPELLILDEPTSGLDPQQIIDIRELIRDLGSDHAVIISSHILSEIASVSTRILVLNKGSIVADSPSDELLNTPNAAPVLDVRVFGDQPHIQAIIKELKGVESLDVQDCIEEGCMDYSITLTEGEDIRKDLSRVLNENGYALMQMKMKNPTLEEIFIDLTSGLPKGGDES